MKFRTRALNLVRWASTYYRSSGGVGVAMALMLMLAGSGVAQTVASVTTDEPVDRARKLEIIDSVTSEVNQRYIFPDVAKKMEANVRKQWKAGAYDSLNTMMTFVPKLSQDMKDISKDGHFGVRYEPNPPNIGDSVTPEMVQREQEEMRRGNYGFKKVEILDGNVGYIDFRGFAPAEWGGNTATAAMKLLENTDAVIIDLRKNGGGDPSMIQLISSYFFDAPVHLNSFMERGSDSIQQFWTSAYIPGKRMKDVPLYILTSNRTFSAAEEFSYNMKNLKRATIVGEVTGGGAHPVSAYVFKDLKVIVRIPYARAINPITGDNWEGKGVKPDIETTAEKALAVAQIDCVGKLAAKATTPEQKRDLEWVAADLASESNPIQVAEAELAAYVGVYGPRTISFDSGQLYSQRQGAPKLKIFPVAKDVFRFEGPGNMMRIKFERDSSGVVTGMVAMFRDGHDEPYPRQGAN